MNTPDPLDERMVFHLLDQYVSPQSEPGWAKGSADSNQAHINWCVEQEYLRGTAVIRAYRGRAEVVRYLPSAITDKGRDYHKELQKNFS